MSARYLIDLKKRKSKIIHVYRNGDKYSRAALVLLRPIEQKELETIFRAVEEKITLPNSKPIKRIFTIEVDEIDKSWQIEDQSYYVVGSTENFMKTHYGTTRYWNILGPEKWSKCTNVIYEPPEKRELSACRSIYDQFKLKITNSAKPSTKMTKSMSAFPSEKRISGKDKNMTLFIDQVRRPVSEPSNDIDNGGDELSPEKINSFEINNSSPESGRLDTSEQMEKFLDDNVNMSQEEDIGSRTKFFRNTNNTDNELIDNKIKCETSTFPNYENDKRENDLKSESELNSESNNVSEEDLNKISLQNINSIGNSEELQGKSENFAHIISDFNDHSEKCMDTEKESDVTNSLSTEKSNAFDYMKTSIAKEEESNRNGNGCLKIKINNIEIQNKDNEIENIDKKSIFLEIDKDDKTDDEISILKEDEIELQEKEYKYRKVNEEDLQSISSNNIKDFNSKKENLDDKDDQREDTEEDQSDNSLYEKEKAALLIQANFRENFKRKFGKTETKSNESVSEKIKSNTNSTVSKYSSENICNDGNYSCNPSNKENDHHTESKVDNNLEKDFQIKNKAATIIQSNIRGHLERENIRHTLKSQKCHEDLYKKNNNLNQDIMENVQEPSEESLSFDEKMDHYNNSDEEKSEELSEINETKKLNENENIKKDISYENQDYDYNSKKPLQENEKEATIIQSNFQGHMVRETLKDFSGLNNDFKEDNISNHLDIENLEEGIRAKEEAAIIIQSNFRGHIVREKIKNKSHQNYDLYEGLPKSDDLNEEDSEEDKRAKEQAAILIQSNFRGHVVRENIKNSFHPNYNIEDGLSKSNNSSEVELKEVIMEKDKTNIVIQSNHHTSEQENSDDEKEEHSDITDENMKKTKENAAILIQSSFRGHMIRAGLKSISTNIEDCITDEEDDRSYAAHDSDDDEEDFNYSPIRNSKFQNKYLDDPFTSCDKD